MIKRLTERGEDGLGSVADQWQWCCVKQEHGRRRSVRGPIRAAAGSRSDEIERFSVGPYSASESAPRGDVVKEIRQPPTLEL